MKRQLQNIEYTNCYKEILYGQECIDYIKSLLIAIKQFYNVFNNLSKNQNSLIYGAEEKLNIYVSILEKKEINFNEMNSFSNIFIKNLKEFFNKLKMNTTLEGKNLLLFLDDVKKLFKNIKDKYQEINKQKRQNTIETLNNRYFKEIDSNYSDFMANIKDHKNHTPETSYKKKINKKLINKKILEKNNNTHKNFKINNELINKNILTIKNRKLSPGLNSFTFNLDNSMNNNIKDKIILSLKEDKKNSNRKINELIKNLNNSKNEIEKLNKEIIFLKQNEVSKKNLSNSINNKSQENELKMKINGLIKENNILKKNIIEIKSKFFNTFFNTNNQANNNLKNIFSNQNNLTPRNLDGNELFKKKLNFIEKNNFDKKNIVKELNSQNILLNNKYQSEILELTNRNSELQENLRNEQNALFNLKNENISKNNKLENLKKLINKTKNIKNQNNLEKKVDNLIKIIEKYKKENDEIKKINYNLKNKIDNYQTEIKNKENKLKYNNSNIIKELKNYYEKKIIELKELKKCYLEQIMVNDAKILNSKFKNEKLNETIKNKDEEINKLLIENKMENNNITNNYNNESLNIKLDNQIILNNNFKKEISNLKKENESLKNNILKKAIDLSEKKRLNKNSDFDILNKKFNTLENDNIKNKTRNKKLENYLKKNFYKNNIKNNKNINIEKIKNKNEEIEALKNLISTMKNENQKKEGEINKLKNENQILKTKLIQLSKNLLQNYNNITIEEKLKNELIKAKDEIDIIKKENRKLVEKLEKSEKKEIHNEIKNFSNKSEVFDMESFEEEYNFIKIKKGLKKKMFSQDINIDYPGIEEIKEKYRELNFIYNSLVKLVKKLLFNIQINQKNKEFVIELCKLVKFDSETTNKLLVNNN